MSQGTSDAGGTATFSERLRKEYEGIEMGVPQIARDPVNVPMIRHWCDALGDELPVYTDEVAAAASLHGGIVAPPTMLQAWTMQGLQPVEGPRNRISDLRAALADAGFGSVVATNLDQEYVRYLRPGDVVTATIVIESISEEKQTALGAGHFVTTRATYSDQHGEVVGTNVMRILLYAPRHAPAAPAATAATADAAAPPKPRRVRPPFNRDTAFFWEGVNEGELRIQRCASCGVLRHPPRPMCNRCHSLEWDWIVSTGRGTVHSFVVYHRPAFPPFEYPNVIVLVELEEGTRIVSNLVDVVPGEVVIDMPVQCRFDNVDEELILPQFSPVS